MVAQEGERSNEFPILKSDGTLQMKNILLLLFKLSWHV